ncbi:MAG: Na+/H+ antiporter subunit C [Chloroflexi bacterium]|nr:Na+/H+ antiporter subunit C [Chloroflexota bacterium]
MTIVLAFLVGGLYAGGLYMMMRRSIVKLIMGLILLSYATTLLIFTVGGLTRAAPPIVPAGVSEPPVPFADPVPQALILTAIVISFGVLAFAVVLIEQTHRSVGTDDSNNLRGIEGEL